MNKQELASYVAQEAGITAAAALKAIDATFECITTCLQKGDDVRLTGFGTFSASARAAREGRNPQTGATISIAASKTAKFKSGQGLKDALNGTTTKTATKKAA
jgi:DNA-binding protein HU-beta